MYLTDLIPWYSGTVLRRVHGTRYHDVPLAEIKFIMRGRREIRYADLKELLLENEVSSSFDPVATAFRVYDTDGVCGSNRRRVTAA